MTRAKRVVQCKDCIAEGVTTVRKPALTSAGNPVPGKRCVTHERWRKQRTKDAAWEKRLIDTYGITAAEYWAIYEAQGGRCYICRRATGKARKLAVDHDHKTGYVRGLTCATDNKSLGFARDDPEHFYRAAEYLKNPPAFAVIGKRIAPIEVPNLTYNVKEQAA
ncbi:endonuclease VII domain-containing protein [Mycolicibacterium houstonense]|uniref:endonuclease VII domain-containing protein n=1 Tax=Mycolicibacterium houstonense TaxID=146021 RepID=UPI000835BB97|nr:endonuclease VII domain-containing protein [Mycolicibacterium houstonense]